MRTIRITLILVLAAAWTPMLPAAPPSPEGVVFFETHIRPLLVDHCYKCHSASSESVKGGLYVDSQYGLLKGGKTAPAVVPGEPGKSLLIKAVRGDDEDLAMPPKKLLPKDKVALLEQWIKMGAPDPRDTKAPAAELTVLSLADAKNFWSFKKPVEPPVPSHRLGSWAKAPMDHFVAAKLSARGLAPAAPADKRTLLRRVFMDLIGLPPTAADVAAFESDGSPDALAKVVDRLLAMPQFGERWARHWLDVARYADTKGYVFQEERRYPFAYTYRDWVINALNADMPYDQFLVYQIAADRALAQKPEPDNRNLAALGFLTVGRRFLNSQPDIIDDRLDVIFRGTQAMTVGCARCHDHKYDPIPIADYYSLYGVFASTVEPGPTELPVLPAGAKTPALEEYEKELARRQAAIDAFIKEVGTGKLDRDKRNKLDELKRKRDALMATHPAAPARAMAVADAPQPVNPVIFKRGNPANRGDAVPRQFPAVLAGEARKPFAQGSGRLELARAIASKDNPLTARVLVNRVMLHLMGGPLVRTPSDFGVRGERPLHPELLDYLSVQFMNDQWSIKRLVRSIVLSSTYQQSAIASPDAVALDPDNALFSRQSRKRLDFEALRDALLWATGNMDQAVGGRPVDLLGQPFPRRRTIYGFVDRQNLPGMFRTFDFASPDTHAPMRFANTVPQQALFMINSPFVIEQAKLVAAKAGPATAPAKDRITTLYQLTLSRNPTPGELQLAAAFIESQPGAPSQLSPFDQLAQVLLLTNEFAFVD